VSCCVPKRRRDARGRWFGLQGKKHETPLEACVVRTSDVWTWGRLNMLNMCIPTRNLIINENEWTKWLDSFSLLI
jgi:hypothetical protein